MMGISALQWGWVIIHLVNGKISQATEPMLFKSTTILLKLEMYLTNIFQIRSNTPSKYIYRHKYNFFCILLSTNTNTNTYLNPILTPPQLRFRIINSRDQEVFHFSWHLIFADGSSTLIIWHILYQKLPFRSNGMDTPTTNLQPPENSFGELAKCSETPTRTFSMVLVS